MAARGRVCGELRLPERRRARTGASVVSEAAPALDHQRLVGSIAILLGRHIRRRKLGQLCLGPMDVVLDRAKILVVNPDLAFVATDRLGIIRDRIMGAPDLVVEVLSWGTDELERTTVLQSYRDNGVRECWLVDPARRQIEVIGLQRKNGLAWRIVEGDQRLGSEVLPGLRCTAAKMFE